MRPEQSRAEANEAGQSRGEVEMCGCNVGIMAVSVAHPSWPASLCRWCVWPSGRNGGSRIVCEHSWVGNLAHRSAASCCGCCCLLLLLWPSASTPRWSASFPDVSRRLREEMAAGPTRHVSIVAGERQIGGAAAPGGARSVTCAGSSGRVCAHPSFPRRGFSPTRSVQGSRWVSGTTSIATARFVG